MYPFHLINQMRSVYRRSLMVPWETLVNITNGPEEKRTTEYIHKVIKKHLKPKSKRSKRAT